MSRRRKVSPVGAFEVRSGTPNEMAVLVRGSLAEARKCALKALEEVDKTATVFDGEAHRRLLEAKDAVRGLTDASFAGAQVWAVELPVTWVTFRVEIRRWGDV